MKVTRILHSHKLNKGKLVQLQEQASLLGIVRSEVWQRYGSIAGVTLRDRTIRDQWMKENRSFSVSANAWKETLRDTIGDIKAYREAAKEKVKEAIRNRTSDDEELKKLYTLLKWDKWQSDPFLRRQMRKHFKHGVNHTHNQIIIRSDMCKTFELGGQCWLKVPNLAKKKAIILPLKTTMEYAPNGTLRLIVKQDHVEVHYQQEVQVESTCGDQVVGIDKGYTEAFVDSDNDCYGEGLGKMISKESDYLNQKYRNRNKLLAIAKKKPHKRAAIEANNLGRQKLDKRQGVQIIELRTLIFTATHRLVDKAGMIVAEDLTSPIASRTNYGKNTNRRLNHWTKGILAEALQTVSQRRCSSLHLVNAAYTSQMDSFNQGLLIGTRKGDKFYRENGEVVQSDHNSAKNVLSRFDDPEIDRWMNFRKVKSILQARTDRYRLELTNLDSSCTLGNEASTESELVLDYV
jgi:hypothetical protein